MAYINNATLLSGLTTYRDELAMNEILTESIFSAKTLQKVKVQTGVKGTQTINLMTSQPVWTVAACGLAAGTGSVTLTQANITVGDIGQTEDICLVGDNTLSKYYTGVLMGKGINQEELTPKIFAKAFIADKMLKTKDYIEHLVWVGNSSGAGTFSSTAGMTLANGFLYQLDLVSGSASVVNGNGTYSGALNAANAINVINGMIAVLPQAIADKDLTLFMSLANYRVVINALITSNNYHFTAIDQSAGPAWEVAWPFAHNVTIVATSGLESRNDLVLTYPENMYVGTDGEHDYEQFNIWYSNDLNAVRFRNQFRIGTAIAYPQYVVHYLG